MDLHFCSMIGEMEKLKQMLVSSVPLQEIIHSGKLSSYTWKYFILSEKFTVICGLQGLSHLPILSLLLFLYLQCVYDYELCKYVKY